MTGLGCRKLNLLVVDDDALIVKLVVKLLGDKLADHVNVFSTTDTTEACEWIDSHCCDILLSDIEMPGRSGPELLHFAKQRNAWTQVIFMTAHSTWDRIAEAIENGAADYLLKPLVAEDLIQVINQECARVARWQQAVRGTLQMA